MLIFGFFSVLIPLGSAVYRDNAKTLRSMPAFTNSLVNLGKMDLSFYFLAKPEDMKKVKNVGQPSAFFMPKTEYDIEEPCPCTSKYVRNFPKNNPSELLTKILTRNDLFSFQKEPKTSALCCESHENVREETIFFEFGPKQSPITDSIQNNNLPYLPYFFNSNVPNKPMLPFKPKAVEIFLFPKKNDLIGDLNKNQKKDYDKEAIKMVGDKEIRNDFKTMTPSQPSQSSVKKDLNLQEKGEKLTIKPETVKIEKKITNPNMV